MKITKNFKKYGTACGEVTRGEIEVRDKEYVVELQPELQLATIIAEDGRAEFLTFDADGETVYSDSESDADAIVLVSEDGSTGWKPRDYAEFTSFARSVLFKP